MVDYHIIGQGLAGSVLALQLLEEGKSIVVSADKTLSASSWTAAGLFNPLIFKKLSKTWLSDLVFPKAQEFYSVQEKKLNSTFWHPMPMLRVFGSQTEKNEWERLRNDPEFAEYIGNDEAPEKMQRFNRGFGTGWVKNCGYLDTTVFLESVHQLLIQKNILQTHTCDPTCLTATQNGWKLNGIESKKIIFCEGWLAVNNPLFSWLPFVPAKGDVIGFHSKELKLDHLLNGGCFVLPLGNDEYRVGATFYWEELNDIPTEKGKQELLKKASELLEIQMEAKIQMAGVRPATADRRPFLGEHPEKKGVYIFNGLGTRGVVLSPWLGSALIDHLEKGQPLHPEINIQRHIKRFSQKI